MLESAHKTRRIGRGGGEILCFGLVVLVIVGVVGGVLYCLLTQPHFIS